MSEYTELTAKIEVLEKRVKYLEDTFATLADMNKSGEMGQFIAQRQRALAASKLVNAAAGTQKLNADAQQKVLDQLAAEKAAMDARIEEAIRASARNTPAEDDLAEQFAYRDVPGGVEIQGFNGFEAPSQLIIPKIIRGKKVVGIGNNAFNNLQFTSVSVPNSVEYFGNETFSGCGRLRNIVLPSGLKSLGYNCFYQTSISEIAIPDGIQQIPYGCFKGCFCLHQVYLPEGLVKIGEPAFEDTSIYKIVIPKTVKNIGANLLTYRNKELHIAILGNQTRFEGISIPYRATVYCNEGSAILKDARLMGKAVKPLSKFPKD